jgi:hypothetical protein
MSIFRKSFIRIAAMDLIFKKRRFSAFLASALAVLLLAGLLLVSCHHHDDAEEHHNCNICAAAHQITSTVFSFFILYLFSAVSFPVLPDFFTFPSQDFLPGTPGRSPPA